MRAMLNNPWVVAGLCLAAIGTIVWKMTSPSSGGGGMGEQVSAIRGQGSAGISQPSTPDKLFPSYEARSLGWHDSIPRDPFRLTDDPLTPQGGSATEDSPPSMITRAATLHLDAVVTEPGEPMAVINGIMVVEGESIEGYRVADIQSDGVWLEGPQGRERIEFNDEDDEADEDE